MNETNKSEVARLRAQIEQETQAAKRGLEGLKAGVARHQFINASLRRLDDHTQALSQHIGSEQAIKERNHIYHHVMEDEDA